MRITSDNFLRATASAMCEEYTVKLIKGVPGTMKMFTLFSALILAEADGKVIDETDYEIIVDSILAQITPDDANELSILKTLSLMTFADVIWEHLKSGVNKS